MNTNEVAERLGVTPRQLRAFLRSPSSTYKAVGSGARYQFTDRDIPTLRTRYDDWARNGRGKVESTNDHTPRSRARVIIPVTQEDRDRAVWAEELAERGGVPIELPNMKDAVVRRRVLAAAREQEDRLNMQLMAVGLHITQLGDRR